MICKMVSAGTDHGGRRCFVINNLGMPQATQGSGYPFQSFFEEKSKKDLHCCPSCKIHSRQKNIAGYPFVLAA